jgi:S-DNA-T family DNA segregation ATPase FtsK/SpoIIIE
MATTKKKTKRGGTSRGSAKRSAPKQQRRDPGITAEFRKEIWGGVCAILALLILLSGLDKESALARFFMGMVGRVGLIVLPIGLVLCAIALFFHGGKPVTMRILCSLSFALLVSAVAHLALDASEAKWGGEMLGVLYKEGAEHLSGGLLGGLLAMLFCLPGGTAVGWAICILLLMVTLPASLNLTLTGLLRAVNDHRDELHRKDRPQRKEPAEVLVERAIQHREIRDERRQERELRRQQRSRFDYDLPVDDPDQARKGETGKQENPVPVQLPLEPVTPRPAQRPRRIDIDLPVDDPVRVSQEKPAPEAAVIPDPEPIFPPKPAASASVPEASSVKTPPSEKVKASEARMAAAEIGMEIENANAYTQEQEKPAYVYPPIDLLDTVAHDSVDASAEMRENTRRLQEKLACFNVDAQIVNVTRGPNVTMYELQLAQGVRLNKLTGLADDIALELGASGVRISAIPDKNSMVGIEVPNKQGSTVSIREVIDSKEFKGAKSKISFAVGKDINGSCVVGDIAKMPHVLIAGTTGSGKSVCTNSILISLLYKATPEEVKLIVVDPKMVEFGIYNGIPHLLIPVVTDAKKAAGALQWAVTEMMRRYRSLSEAGVRDIESYNKLAAEDEALEAIPKLVVVIDELADLMLVAGKEVEEAICRIAQMGRAAGVHLVIATQRPSADVITGLMKANIPSRIALVVSSAMESRIILDAMGAEKLIGRGDMLYAPLGKGKKRVQGCYIDETEVQRVIDFVKANGSADYNDEVQQEIEQRASQSGKGNPASASATPSNPSGAAAEEESGDELLPAAVEVILETGLCSVSLLQRRLKLGYARAARIVDEMEERGIVGPFEGSKPRQLLITKEQWAAMQNGVPMDLEGPAAEADEPVEELLEP